MRPHWAQSLAAWLNPPRHLEEHGRVELTPEQRRHAQPTEGRRRLRGVAGPARALFSLIALLLVLLLESAFWCSHSTSRSRTTCAT